MKTQVLFAALLTLAAAGANAACERPTDAPPEVPNGARADEEAMRVAHDGIQAYVNKLEAYKTCLKTQADSAPADTPAELKLTWIAQGDAAVDNASFIAAQFSYALKTYKERTTPAPAGAAKQ